jgi:DNA-binding MarR family transcriptional regulator
MTQPPASDAVSQCNCTALRKASRRVSQMYDGALAPCGLKSTQFSILSEIERHGDQSLTMGKLADAMIMDRSTLGHNLRPLEHDGLISIVTCKADRRWKQVVLTGKGRETYARAYSLWHEAQRHFEHSFGASEAVTLRTTLLGLAANSALSGTCLPDVSAEPRDNGR